jgi:hypothetical protein
MEFVKKVICYQTKPGHSHVILYCWKENTHVDSDHGGFAAMTSKRSPDDVVAFRPSCGKGPV